jgi:hypothetical protein
MGRLPKTLRGKRLNQKIYRIDDKVSNYWANPDRANLQMTSQSVIRPGATHRVTSQLSPNALELIVLEPAR